jgi:hypothetical protein
MLSNRRDNLRGVAELGRLEEILVRPAAGHVDADTASCFADARTDLEQPNAQRFDLCWAQGRRQLQTKLVDQVIGETAAQQAERIGPKAVAAQAVSSKPILELFNPVLTFPAIVIKGKNGTAAAYQVDDRKTQVGTEGGVFDPVADAPLMRPGVRPTQKCEMTPNDFRLLLAKTKKIRKSR